MMSPKVWRVCKRRWANRKLIRIQMNALQMFSRWFRRRFWLSGTKRPSPDFRDESSSNSTFPQETRWKWAGTRFTSCRGIFHEAHHRWTLERVWRGHDLWKQNTPFWANHCRNYIWGYFSLKNREGKDDDGKTINMCIMSFSAFSVVWCLNGF